MSEVIININIQQLMLYQKGRFIKAYPISTALKGVGERYGSEQTPRGLHQIRLKIGEGCPINTVFVGRRSTGEIYTPELAQKYPERDWILTRILWLSGLEPGKNRFGQVDTLRRFIYIHGTPDTAFINQPSSHGCIRLRNQDILALFEQVSVGDRISIGM